MKRQLYVCVVFIKSNWSVYIRRTVTIRMELIPSKWKRWSKSKRSVQQPQCSFLRICFVVVVAVLKANGAAIAIPTPLYSFHFLLLLLLLSLWGFFCLFFLHVFPLVLFFVNFEIWRCEMEIVYWQFNNFHIFLLRFIIYLLLFLLSFLLYFFFCRCHPFL